MVSKLTTFLNIHWASFNIRVDFTELLELCYNPLVLLTFFFFFSPRMWFDYSMGQRGSAR